ncbi:hypothetical protein H8356DRAFT_1419735 [Neocallimastix lanati (nom. inval.)]|nr:hypothetical protein H8356DRAFT_1419735 [Neocallimastix sp. JGI-2020a]
MAIQLLINCKLRRSQSSLHTARRCIPNVPTYISNDHEHQNGTINSSLVGVIIGDWKFYNHQALCFNSKRSIRDGLMDITCGLMISQDRNLIRLFVTFFPSGFYDNALIEQLQVFWAYIRKNGTNLSRYLSYIQIVNNMISAIPDDRGVGSMTVNPDFRKVVERRRQNDKACKDLNHVRKYLDLRLAKEHLPNLIQFSYNKNYPKSITLASKIFVITQIPDRISGIFNDFKLCYPIIEDMIELNIQSGSKTYNINECHLYPDIVTDTIKQGIKKAKQQLEYKIHY